MQFARAVSKQLPAMAARNGEGPSVSSAGNGAGRRLFHRVRSASTDAPSRRESSARATCRKTGPVRTSPATLSRTRVPPRASGRLWQWCPVFVPNGRAGCDYPPRYLLLPARGYWPGGADNHFPARPLLFHYRRL